MPRPVLRFERAEDSNCPYGTPLRFRVQGESRTQHDAVSMVERTPICQQQRESAQEDP